MRPLRYSINVSLDGSCDHRVFRPTEELHQHHADNLEAADALLLGRVTYQMMEEAWRLPASGTWPDWMDDSLVPFARTIDEAQKHVASTTLDDVDWNADLLEGELEQAVRTLKEQPGDGLYVGGVALPTALAAWGLIDEYDLVVHPVVAGHGPYLLGGLRQELDLELVERTTFSCGAVAQRLRVRT